MKRFVVDFYELRRRQFLKFNRYSIHVRHKKKCYTEIIINVFQMREKTVK